MRLLPRCTPPPMPRAAARALLMALATSATAAAAGACDDTGSPMSDGTPSADARGGGGSGVTYHRDVRPLLEAHCNGCHTDGGAAPFGLETYDDARAYSGASLAAIAAGTMPPWPPDPSCRHYRHERVLPTGAEATLQAWVDAGTPEGDAADYVAPDVPAAPDFVVTHEAGLPEPYAPLLEESDDYRCFLLDMAFPEDLYLKGANVIPGNGLVHHVLVYALTGDQAAQALAQDEAEAGPGYTCFGGPIAGIGGEGGPNFDSLAGGFPTQIAAWVPGNTPTVSEDDMAMRIDAGATIVMQIHYSVVAGQSEVDSDTRLQLMLSDEAPALLRTSMPLAIRRLEIPAGEPSAEHVQTFTYHGETPREIRSISGHMHLLGQRISMHVERADGARECGLDIPQWDFSWQSGYEMEAGDALMLYDGDRVEVRCVYDNSAANQPTVSGVQLEPRDVAWGDGTLDEMCLLYLGSVTPYVPPAPTSCDPACAAACGGAPTASCLAECDASVACSACGLAEVTQCPGALGCLLAEAQTMECLTECVTTGLMLGSDFGRCMDRTCADAWSGALACLDDASASCSAAALEACWAGD